MPRAIVTQSLSDTIKLIRTQNKIQAKQVADYINKSAAFITKLENGNMKSIDSEDLYAILKFISNNESDTDLANRIYDSLRLKYSKKEISNQLWFHNFDTVECLIPIPESLIAAFNKKIQDLNISRDYLLRRINANESLLESEITNQKIPYNVWFHREWDEETGQGIKINLSKVTLDSILDGETDVSPYIFVFCILFYLNKIQQYGDVTNLSVNENDRLFEKTTLELNNFKFLSISEKNLLLSQNENKEILSEMLN